MRQLTPRFLLLWLFSSLYGGVKPERLGSGDIVESQITFTCKFRERYCNGLSKTKRAGTKETIRLPSLYPSYNNTCTLEEPQATPWANRGCLQICLQVRVLAFIVGFYSRGRQLCKFIATKESLDQFRLLGNCPTTPLLVSLAASFWMSRNAPRSLLGERCVTSRKRLRGRLPHPYPMLKNISKLLILLPSYCRASEPEATEQGSRPNLHRDKNFRFLPTMHLDF